MADKNLTSSLGARVRWGLEHRGLTQTELCEKTGLQRSFLSNVISAQRGGRIDSTEVLAAGLDVSFVWLAISKGSPELDVTLRVLRKPDVPRTGGPAQVSACLVAFTAARVVALRELWPEKAVQAAMRVAIEQYPAPERDGEGRQRLNGVEWVEAVEHVLAARTHEHSGVVPRVGTRFGMPVEEWAVIASHSPTKYSGATMAEERGVPPEVLGRLLRSLPADAASTTEEWLELFVRHARKAPARKAR